jgi:hypothetical protein
MEGWSVSDFFLALLGILVSVAGWFMRQLHDNHKKLEDKVNDHHSDSHEKFVRRDDFKEIMSEIRATCDKIFAKLDSKADKESMR